MEATVRSVPVARGDPGRHRQRAQQRLWGRRVPDQVSGADALRPPARDRDGRPGRCRGRGGGPVRWCAVVEGEMLAAERLRLAIDIHAQSYKLLRWVAQAVRKGFIPATRAHEYANASDAALDWMQEHYLNFPRGTRPDRQHLREFANFFATYVTSSFDIIEQPGMRLDSPCGCYCPMCSRLVHAPHLQVKKLTKRDKNRAQRLMIQRVAALAREEGIDISDEAVLAVVQGDETRRAAGYSAYGYWLIRRLEGDTDGTAILALWREIAWKRTGSPIKNFQLEYKDFVDAEESLANALRSNGPDNTSAPSSRPPASQSE